MSILKLLQSRWNPPASSTESFSGKTVLVTGASGGLGLEAAKKLARLNAKKLVITARTDTRGAEAKSNIENWLKASQISSDTEIIVVPLDMSTADGVKAFTAELKSIVQTLDAAILNAGVFKVEYRKSGDDYEETIQVNTLSTVLLGFCLLPLLLSTADVTKQSTHLLFVSSGTATRVRFESLQPFLSEELPIKSMSAEEHFPPGVLGGAAKYAQSKLLLEYAMRHMAALPSLYEPSGSPKVIVNSVCPGMCKSDLGRESNGYLATAAKWMVYTFLARSAEQGADQYITGLTQGKEGHGKLWRKDQYEPEWEALSTEEGRQFGDKIWSEIRDILKGWDPAIKSKL